MIDSFMAWAQAFMLQVALAARSGASVVMLAMSLGIFLWVMWRGVWPLTRSKLNRFLLALPVFVGSFSILFYISLARVEINPDEFRPVLMVMSYVSGAVLSWAVFLLLRDLLIAGYRIYRRLCGKKMEPVLDKMATGVMNVHSSITGKKIVTVSDDMTEAEKENAPKPQCSDSPAIDMVRRNFLRNGGVMLIGSAFGASCVSKAMDLPALIRQEFSFDSLPEELDGLRIVQLSDLHIGPLQTAEWLEAVVGRINTLDADLIVITGDFVDGSPSELLPMVKILGGLKAKHGIYSCAGNHDFYSGIKRWLPHFQQLGLNMLRNEHRVLTINGGKLTMLGLNDKNESAAGNGSDMNAALAGAPEGVFRILLEHHPEAAPQRAGLVDLMLSGHTHGGQMSLFRPLVRRANGGFVAGAYDVDGLKLYVNRGTGVWGGLAMRLDVPAEVTLFTLHSGKKKA